MTRDFSVDNRDVAQFLVTKISWKGRYKRIFSVGTLAISTYNPETLEVTNQWLYSDFIGIVPSPKSNPNSFDQFQINFYKKNRSSVEKMTFCSECTQDILTEVLAFQSKYSPESVKNFMRVNAYKPNRMDRDQQIPLILQVTSCSVEQIDSRKIVVASYPFKEIRQLIKISDYPSGFVVEVGEQRRRRMFATQEMDRLIQEIRRCAGENIGIQIDVAKSPITRDDFEQTRWGLYSRDEQLVSYVDFRVYKQSVRHDQAILRLLCLSENCIVERDCATYTTICVHPLKHVVCLSRDPRNPQQFSIEYENGVLRTYQSNERDLVLASLIDGAKAAAGLKRVDLVRRFNSNIPYNGMAHQTTEKQALDCLEAVLSESYLPSDTDLILKCEAQLQALHRLFGSKHGFQAFATVPGIREKLGVFIVSVLKIGSETLDYAAVEMLNALMQPLHSNYELRHEQNNKQSLLSSDKFVDHLLELVVSHINRGTGFLVIASVLDFLTYAVCAPFSETTEGQTFDRVLELVAAKGRSFYKLFQNPSMTIVKGAGLVMRAIIEESSVEISKSMQLLSLTEGAFLRHLQMALLLTGHDLRYLANRQLSGQLISLWIADNDAAKDLLKRCLPRGLLDFLDSAEKAPNSDSDFLLSRNNLETASSESKQSKWVEQMQSMQYTLEAKIDSMLPKLDSVLQHWNLDYKVTFLQKRIEERNQQQAKQNKPVILRKSRKRVKSGVNWRMFAYQFGKDHAKADLLWNAKTREEFRLSIENELRQLTAESDLAVTETPISWNHTEFIAHYASLSEEIKVGDYYLRHLLGETEANATPIHDPKQFFNDVYHRFLLTPKSEMRCLCLKAMAITYERHNITIGAFSDTRDIVAMLQRTTNIAERDHFVLLLSKLALNKENVRQMINGGALSLLVDLASLAHLHVSRATLKNQSNVIESGRDRDSEGTPEWYYYDKKGDKQGPVTYGKMKDMYGSQEIFEKTEVWAEGLGQWCALSSVPQFRWTICCRSNAAPVYNPTELCTLVLDVFIQMTEFFPSRDQNDCVIRPLPAVKRILSDSLSLSSVVQLLLTYDPAIVHRVAKLIYLVMQDNPYISRLYMTGLFFFILMYNGSDILSIARLLHYSHNKQSFRSATATSELIARSILSPLLPEAAIFYLEEYGVEKYAEVYLGEFDNPEIIWNNEMRRHLISQIACHVSDFSSRLPSNIKAIYRYCPISPIEYDQLKDELFCHVYYLRHLCDVQKFPNWPIRDPVPFLRDCLATWHDEINKKPPEMSIEEACNVLGISINDGAWRDRSKLRKAYLKLSLEYHPDKRADGQEMFQKINFAHEILSTAQRSPGGGLLPNVQRIVICLCAQSIIYSRHSEVLAPYKYAGYSQLIKTIDLESKDDGLFRDGGGDLLSAAVELCAYTLASSSLNAEQLRRDNGMEALLTAFDRCEPMVNLSTKESDVCARVCIDVCRCFTTAAKFEGSRERLSEMKTLFPALCRLLKFEKLGRLASAAAECICSLAVCTLLQTQLFQAGVLWELLPHLFRYDYTLEEGGVEHSENTNQQAVWNRLARGSCEAMASLAGYRQHTPENDGVQNSLRAMLSPYVCRLMKEGGNNRVLKILNSNTEDPYIIWDNATRSELMEFVDRHRENSGLTSELFGAEFQMTAHKNEFVIGDIFVRIYNEQPHFKLHDPKSFCVDLLDFLKKNQNTILGKKKNNEGTPNEEEFLVDWGVVGDGSGMLSLPKRVEMCIEALNNVIRADASLTYLLIGQFGLIFSYLQAYSYAKIQKSILEVIYQSASNADCLTDIASLKNNDKAVKLPLLLPLVEKLPEVTERVLHTLGALASNGALAKELLEYGGIVYILGVYTDVHSRMRTAAAPEAGRNRVTAAELLSKLQSDNQSGPRWNRFISRFLPPIFADGLRDSPQAAVAMFDSDNETPELIWNDTVRQNVRGLIQRMLSSLVQSQLIDPRAKWNDGALGDCAYGSTYSGEVVVGGVFLRLFNANPTWAVRHPKQFTTELMERVLQLMEKPTDEIEIATTTLVNLIAHHPTTADQLPAQGYLPTFCRAMTLKNAPASKTALLVVEQIAGNTYCVEALSRLPVIRGIHLCMKNQPAFVREAAHALKLLFRQNSSALSEQMLSSDIVPHLLNVLGSRDLQGVSNPAAAKAEIVEALKNAALDLQYGDKITAILNDSTIWKEYKDQRHDLYLPAARPHAITGGPTGSGLALTFGTSDGRNTDGMFAPPPRPVPSPKPTLNDR
ncbi:hypothetical protein QR680_009446 [Steinernema hermaphroditum]|uniref:J domain-containing protein n=1 Tax=Steinernema hermaphroditum TaxID=289476 RepID=A0AA39M9E9_9BILA|nr:hypothetical protein QR680_009446 [Steinernema hermaphroditum]